MALDPVVFLSPSSIGNAIVITVANIDSPTELNSVGAAQGELRLARTTEAGDSSQTLYYLDTTSSSQSLPYVVTSATAGLKWLAVAGHAVNQSVRIAGGSNIVALEAGSNARALSTYVALNSAAGQTRAFAFQSGGNFRWLVSANNVSESGSNAGSNFQINAYDDAGNFIDGPLSITRVSGGAITLARPTNITNTTSASSSTTGAVTIGNGTAATNVGIGGGNINAGGTLINNSMAGLSGGTNSFAAVTIGQTNSTSGTAQEAVYINFTATSGATTLIVGAQSQIATAAASFTAADAINFYASQITKGAGSTITRATNYFSRRHATAPSNQAAFYHGAGAAPAYTGEWCIYVDGAFDNYFGTGVATFAGTTDATSSTGAINTAGGIYAAKLINTSSGFRVFTGATLALRATFSGTDGLVDAGNGSLLLQAGSGTKLTLAASLATLSTRTTVSITDHTDVAISTTGTAAISGAVTDGYIGAVGFNPAYSGAFTVTRHNYIACNNVSLSSTTLTDACLVRFNAAAGTHKAVDSGTTKTTPGTVDAWVKININGTVYYMPAYTSKTT